jgi:acetate---CoA ligase (ADP-forming)
MPGVAGAALHQALLAPRSVAVIGQSNDAAKAAGRPLAYLRQGGFRGAVYPVNARRESVLGERAYPRIDALPEVPDHAYLVVPTDAVAETVEACGRFGVKVATVMAAGFGEVGPVGAAREEKLRAIAAATGIRIVGPSSLGVVNLNHRLYLTANAAFGEGDIPVGRIFAASQSGSMIGALVSRGKARGIGFAGLVSVGNEVDLSLGEICAATLDDPDIDGYLLFLETLRQSDTLRAFAIEAAARNRPVVAYKLGRSAEARELAVTHTGALAGEDDVAGAFLADCGIARVDTLEGFLEAMPLARRVPIRPAGAPARVAVVTTTAGGATMAVDPLAVRGVNIAGPSAATLARFAAKGIDVTPARLVDLTVAGARYEPMKTALDILMTAPEFDLVLAVVGSWARSDPQAATRPIIECAAGARPIAAYLVPEAPDALARLAVAGVPSFRTPEACADAIAATLARRPPKPMVARPGTSGQARMLDEIEAYALLDRLGIAHAPAVALDSGIAQAPKLPFAYPVAVKVLSAAIAHKTEAGGVALDVRDGDDLLRVLETMRDAVRARTDTPVERVMVAPMIAGVGEALVGYRVDREAGPLVMVAAGGVYTELYRDRSLRLAPVDLATAQAMIGEVKALRVLAGYRGKPRGDLDALARALVALSQLAADGSVAEAEINPLIVRADGVVAVDALVRMV